MAITFDNSFSWLPQSKLQKDASEEQMLKDGQYYRLTYGSHVVFSDNKDINGLAQNPITELIRDNIKNLKKYYDPELSAWESMNNARRVALKNIEQEINHATESQKNEKKFTKEQVNDKWHHNITSTSKQKTLLTMTNFWRIYWIFIRFNINELWLSWNHLFASIWVIDAATLSAHFDMLNATSCFLSIALYGLRLLIEIGTAIKHIAQAEDGEKLKQFFIEVHKRWSDCLNCVVWLVINLLTNYPAVCGIPLSVCYPLIAVVLLFDVWLSHQKHFEDDRKFESAITLVDEDIEECFQSLSQKLTSIKIYFSNSSELATQLEKIREARKTISGSDNDGDLNTLNKLEALLLEKQALLDSKAVNDSLHEWNKTAVKFLFGAFSASVVISFWATPPGAILGCYMICALSIASFMKGGDYAKIQELKQQLKAAKDDTETLFTVEELHKYEKGSGLYNNEVKKRINSIEQEINNKWNNLILDVAVMAVLPPLIIGSLAICWPLAIAAAVVAISYLAFKFVQPSSPKEELPKVYRYRLFSQDGLTDKKDIETASITTDNTSRTNSVDSSISSSDDGYIADTEEEFTKEDLSKKAKYWKRLVKNEEGSEKKEKEDYLKSLLVFIDKNPDELERVTKDITEIAYNRDPNNFIRTNKTKLANDFYLAVLTHYDPEFFENFRDDFSSEKIKINTLPLSETNLTMLSTVNKTLNKLQNIPASEVNNLAWENFLVSIFIPMLRKPKINIPQETKWDISQDELVDIFIQINPGGTHHEEAKRFKEKIDGKTHDEKRNIIEQELKEISMNPKRYFSKDPFVQFLKFSATYYNEKCEIIDDLIQTAREEEHMEIFFSEFVCNDSPENSHSLSR